MRGVYVIFILLLPTIGISQNDGNLFDFDQSYRYAEYLFNSRQYREAAIEYERVLFFQPNNLDIQKYLIKAYLRSQQYETGKRRLLGLYPNLTDMKKELTFSYGKILLMQKDFPSLQLLLEHPELFSLENHTFLGISAALISQSWGQAQDLYQTNQTGSQSLGMFEPVIKKTQQLKLKKPIIAMGMSSLVPGSGRFYTKQWKDGLLSLLIVGGLSYTAYRNFSRKGGSRALGYIYAGLAIGFYGGNIYGSFESAHRYNELQQNEILDDSYHIIRQHL